MVCGEYSSIDKSWVRRWVSMQRGGEKRMKARKKEKKGERGKIKGKKKKSTNSVTASPTLVSATDKVVVIDEVSEV